MNYLHSSIYKSHGSLIPGNLLIDSKFAVKITNFGLFEFKRRCKLEEAKSAEKLLYSAPELLRIVPGPPLKGTQAGDIYAFGLILYEIIGRQGPFGSSGMDAEEVVARLKGEIGANCRPSIADLPSTPYFLVKLMESCWDEETSMRPSFSGILDKLKPLRKGM